MALCNSKLQGRPQQLWCMVLPLWSCLAYTAKLFDYHILGQVPREVSSSWEKIIVCNSMWPCKANTIIIFIKSLSINHSTLESMTSVSWYYFLDSQPVWARWAWNFDASKSDWISGSLSRNLEVDNIWLLLFFEASYQFVVIGPNFCMLMNRCLFTSQIVYSVKMCSVSF